MCQIDKERLRVAHPEEYEKVKDMDFDKVNKECGFCNEKYRPHLDGAAALVEMLVTRDDLEGQEEWWPIVSELMPEHIADRIQCAQAEWHKIGKFTSATLLQAKIIANATMPKTCTLRIPGLPLTCIGQFPLEDFYAGGGKAVTQKDWIKYFHHIASGVQAPACRALAKACERFAKIKGNEFNLSTDAEFLPQGMNPSAASRPS
jgi:hypothetical protein